MISYDVIDATALFIGLLLNSHVYPYDGDMMNDRKFAGLRKHVLLYVPNVNAFMSVTVLPNDKSTLSSMHATGFITATLNRAKMSFVEPRRANFTMRPT